LADEGGDIELRNCPFHSLAHDHREVVCGLNLRLVEGVIAGSAHPRARAELDPRPGRCCVVVHDAAAAARTDAPHRRRRSFPRMPHRKGDDDE